MKKAQARETVQTFLQDKRNSDTEREGWFSMFEITGGIREDLNIKIHLFRVAESLKYLQEMCDPPRVEDTWMLSNEEGTPILSTHYSHPSQPESARRFYRATGADLETTNS